MTSTTTRPISNASNLLEEALNQPPIGETANFAWNAPPIGIAAIYKGSSPSKPPYEQAIKEGEQLAMDLSREEKEFYLTQKEIYLLCLLAN